MTTTEELTVPMVDSKVTTEEELRVTAFNLEVTTEVRATEELTVTVVDLEATTEELSATAFDSDATTGREADGDLLTRRRPLRS